MNINPVIMVGGSGTRLWPLSRKAAPKQFQKLVSDKTMLEETLDRVGGEGFAAPVFIGSAIHEDLLRDHAGEVRGRVILEPFGRNTGPAAIMAALASGAGDDLVLLLPADHHIADPEGFIEAVQRGADAAREGRLVTLGIAPTGPETGYGYIRQGAEISEGVFEVQAVVEKPDRATAERYLADGNYAWNAGIFLFRAESLLAEAERHAPEMLKASVTAFEGSREEDGVRLLDEEAFGAVPSDSIDYAIMEKTDKAAVVSPVTIGWNDIGSWAAVKDFAETEEGGDILTVDCSDTLIKRTGDGPAVTAIGLQGMVVVATRDAILITPADRAQDVKAVIEKLKEEGREDLL
jgi:mannose-1-phosphate guanylyltransferase/mannose-6-phosphate isomerase